MTARRTHDADLCDRIRALEEEVAALKARPTHYCGWGCNHYPNWWTSPTYVPTWTVGTTTTGNVTTGTITYGN